MGAAQVCQYQNGAHKSQNERFVAYRRGRSESVWLSRKLDKKIFESIYDSTFKIINLVRIHGKIDVDNARSVKEYWSISVSGYR